MDEVLRRRHLKYSERKQDAKDPLIRYLMPMRTSGPILCKERKMAKLYWDITMQAEAFGDILQGLRSSELKKPEMIKKLGLKKDEDGLIRCHGRFVNSKAPQEGRKFPVLLARNTKYAELIIRNCHEEALHSGVQHTLADVRQQYWLPRGRKTVQNLLHKCHVCRKVQGGPYPAPPMAPLPAERITRAKPFQFTGLDYLGPVWYKLANGEKFKSWICLFTCLVTRAVHLELVMDMTAAEFLNALRRFISRRGIPEKIVSDNASQFKLVKDTIKLAWNEMYNVPDVMSYCTKKSIQYK